MVFEVRPIIEYPEPPAGMLTGFVPNVAVSPEDVWAVRVRVRGPSMLIMKKETAAPGLPTLNEALVPPELKMKLVT